MSESARNDDLDARGRVVLRHRPALLWILIVLLTAEFAVMAVITVVIGALSATGQADTFAGGVAFLVLALVATVWLGFIVVAAYRGHAWMRGAAIVFQVLVFAVGVGCFRGLTAEPALGFALVVPAVAIVALLVSPPVVKVTSTR